MRTDGKPAAPAAGSSRGPWAGRFAVPAVGLVVGMLLTGAAGAAHSPDSCPQDFNPPAPFTDRAAISPVHIRNVDCAYNHAIVTGLVDGSYAPREHVRRDQMVAFVSGMLEAAGHELPDPSPHGFVDVATSAHRDRIAQLARIGVVTGTGEGDRFAPRRTVSRGQVAAFLLRAAAWATGQDVETLLGDPDATGFADVHSGQAHGPAIAGAVRLGLTQGRTETRYAPNRSVPRQQMASFMVPAFRILLVDGPAAVDTGEFRGAARPLPPALRARMEGVSWRSGCPVALADLALLELTHHDFDGRVRVGELVVEARVADDVLDAFSRIFEAGFPIERMRLIEEYGGSDDRSMADNNSSAFNCRPVTGGGGFSEHAYGRAIDINPVQNPYVRGGDVQPDAGRGYLDRATRARGWSSGPGP